jgi:hypothetical protein
MRRLLDGLTCRLAIQEAESLIKSLSEQDDRSHLCIVVADPLFFPWGLQRHQWLERGILHHHEIGDPLDWKRNYRVFAQNKAWLSAKYRMPSRVVQTDCPFLLDEGDILYGGSVYIDGLVVATSGLTEEHDENVSQFVATRIIRLCKEARQSIVPGGDYGAFLK